MATYQVYFVVCSVRGGNSEKSVARFALSSPEIPHISTSASKGGCSRAHRRAWVQGFASEFLRISPDKSTCRQVVNRTPSYRECRFSGTTGDLVRDLSVLTVALSGKSSDNSGPRRNSMKLRIEFTGPRGERATGWVSNGFGIDGGISNENRGSMFLLVARGVFIGAASAR